MRVVVNQLAATGRKTGIGHYTLQLLRCLVAQAGEDVVDTFPRTWMKRVPEVLSLLRSRVDPGEAATPSGPSRKSQVAPMRRRTLHLLRQVNRLIWTQYFRDTCKQRSYDVYHEPNFIPFPSDRPTVATVHDLSVLLHPEWHPADRVTHFARHFRRGVARCCHFFAISEFGRQEIIRHLNIPPERVTRTYMGVRPGLRLLPADEVAATLRDLKLPPRYVLCLGTIEPRKNIRLLLQAYCGLPAALRERWPLLLVGGWGWNSGDVAAYLHDTARHHGVIHVGYLPEPHMAAVYNGARALLYPSLYEGFGMPPIEMMACGGAVLASTAGALVETVGGRAHLISPHDEEGWRGAMRRVIVDADWWQSLRHGGAALAQSFTWERCAADTWRVYRAVAAGRIPETSTPHPPLAA